VKGEEGKGDREIEKQRQRDRGERKGMPSVGGRYLRTVTVR
jgi:hypothetical protein